MTRRPDPVFPTRLWTSERFTSLPATTQHLYLMLRTQPGVSACGLLTADPSAWAHLCSPARPLPAVHKDLDTLTELRFITSSPGTREVLVRRWISDTPPATAIAADTLRSAVREVQSGRVRADVTADLIAVMQRDLPKPVRSRLAEVLHWLEHGSRRQVEPAALFTTELAGVATARNTPDGVPVPSPAETPLTDPVNARAMTAWWIDAYRTAHRGDVPSKPMIGAWSRNARLAIESGQYPDSVLRDAATLAGKRGATAPDRIIESLTREAASSTRVSYQHTDGEAAGSTVLDLVSVGKEQQ